jgi:hypothetical protein
VLNKIQNGEGVLQTTMMSVNDLGKIDVYSYLYFLAKHAERHISQMQKNEMAYISKPINILNINDLQIQVLIQPL